MRLQETCHDICLYVELSVGMYIRHLTLGRIVNIYLGIIASTPCYLISCLSSNSDFNCAGETLAHYLFLLI
jgi:hypothetical protein